MTEAGPGWRILRVAGQVETPWKNGGGVTAKIAAAPPGAGLDAFDWRISRATVAASSVAANAAAAALLPACNACTRAPACNNASLMARPMPRVPPVTMAVWPLKSY